MSVHATSHVNNHNRERIARVDVSQFLELQKYRGIGQTLVSKTEVSFTPKQPRVFNSKVLFTNHGMVLKLKKYFVSKALSFLREKIGHDVVRVNALQIASSYIH
jgi:hypothetical protein